MTMALSSLEVSFRLEWSIRTLGGRNLLRRELLLIFLSLRLLLLLKVLERIAGITVREGGLMTTKGLVRRLLGL